jgi:ribosomal-protein-alanine N-acetyltransferase
MTPSSMQDIAQLLSIQLVTPRLVIRPLMSSDAKLAFPGLQDDAIRQWISMPRPSTVASLRESWKHRESRMSPDGTEAWLSWFVTSRSDLSPMGSVDACIDGNQIAVNFGYYFFTHSWGQGVATEAVQTVSHHLLSRGVKKLVATVTAGNIASMRVLQKAGFEFSRTIQDNDTVNGVLMDDNEFVRVAVASQGCVESAG